MKGDLRGERDDERNEGRRRVSHDRECTGYKRVHTSLTVSSSYSFFSSLLSLVVVVILFLRTIEVYIGHVVRASFMFVIIS